MFIGRERELAFLNKLYVSDKFDFADTCRFFKNFSPRIKR